MKKIIGIVIVMCLFAAPKMFAGSASNGDCTIEVVAPICVFADGADNLGIFINTDDDVHYPNAQVNFVPQIKFYITGTDGHNISYTLAFDDAQTTAGAPNLTYSTGHPLGTFTDQTTSERLDVYLEITDAATNGASAQVYTYYFTCTADYATF